MATLSGQTDTYGARIPVRIERLSGALVALATSELDGSWSVEVEPGDYVVVERGGRTYAMSQQEFLLNVETAEQANMPSQRRLADSLAHRRNARDRHAVASNAQNTVVREAVHRVGELLAARQQEPS